MILTNARLALALLACNALPSWASPDADADVAVLSSSGADGNVQARWAKAKAQAKAKISSWTLEEKVAVTTGVGWQQGHCVGNTFPVEEKGFPSLCLEDSPLGVRFADFASAFPAGINAAATWDRGLIHKRGAAMGAEFRGKGVHIALGPMMNIGRVAEGGRNWEGFGADPFLQGEAAFETVTGIQSAGVQACAKHYINNEQEAQRDTSTSDVDDRTEHEIYLHPFLRSVQAGVASIMCSYNQINSTYACENEPLLNHTLKYEMGFEGYVMSDWGATHSTQSAVTGLDMTMPGGSQFSSLDSYFGGNLTAAVENGTISESRVDDMALRIVGAWYLLGQDKNYPDVSFDAFKPKDPVQKHIDVQDDHYKIIREIGAASTILLKNDNNTLPLCKPRSIALIGSDAGPGSKGPNGYADRAGLDGILAMGWGSGTVDFPYLISPLEAIQARAREDRTSVSWWLQDFDTDGAASAVSNVEVAIVFVASDSGEGYLTVDGNEGDRNNLTAWHNGDNLVLAVASQNPNTIVVVHSVGPMIVEPWIDHPNITAVVWGGIAGQETGNALVDILYGAVSPSGRLPYTIAKQVSDYPTTVIRDTLIIPYTEGLFIDYRHFDAQSITPRYEFGFGLSYTSFKYSNLKISYNGGDDDKTKLWKAGQVAETTKGASIATWLHKKAYTVSFTVKNTGGVDSNEVPQLYLSFPASTSSPPQVLKGFSRVWLKCDQSKTVELTLSRYDLSVWSAEQQGWVGPQGTVGVAVGASSRDKRLSGEIAL